MNKRERLERAIIGEAPDRPPVAIWRHFPGDDLRSADFARSIIDFQQAFDWDIMVVSPNPGYAVSDYGLHEEWRGDPDGLYDVIRRGITRSLDWTLLRPLDPQRGALGRQLECLDIVTRFAQEEIPVVVCLSSPLAQARMIAGDVTLSLHLRTETDRLRTGLNVLTENLLRFMDQLRRLPIAGILYAIPDASYAVLSEHEYQMFGLEFDMKLMDSLPPKWWLNIVQLQASAPMFKYASQLKSQVVNWADQDSEPDLAMGKTLFDGAVCGGLSRTEHLHQSTPITIRKQVREAVQKTGGRRLIVSTSGPITITTPLSNLRAAREAVEEP